MITEEILQEAEAQRASTAVLREAIAPKTDLRSLRAIRAPHGILAIRSEERGRVILWTDNAITLVRDDGRVRLLRIA